jgi:hypothetical protein
LFILLLLIAVSIAACTGSNTPEPPPDPIALVTEASQNIRLSETFRMEVVRTGAEYYVPTDLGNVDFKRAVAQYVAPNILQATVRVIAAGLPADVDIFSRGEDQWFRNTILTANIWLNAPFAEGFNPERLIAEDTGFQMALHSLINLSYEGREQLEDGTDVHHLAGTARGEDITALMANLVEATGEVLVDVFIDQQALIPVRFIIVQPNTITDDEPEPTTWTVDVYDINAEPELDAPETAS